MEPSRRQLILSCAESLCRKHDWEFANDYGEPGYSYSADAGVVLGNFWERRPDGELFYMLDRWPRLQEAWREIGLEFEWSDEWIVDYGESLAYRTSADSYGWMPSVALDFDACEWLTPDSDVLDWIAYATNGPDGYQCVNDRQVKMSALLDAGFTRWPDDDTAFETGWHPGQTDDPVKMIAEAKANDHDAILFVLDVGQFDSRWCVLIRPVE